eukprot:811001-Rhodomonas_salina.1
MHRYAVEKVILNFNVAVHDATPVEVLERAEQTTHVLLDEAARLCDNHYAVLKNDVADLVPGDQ